MLSAADREIRLGIGIPAPEVTGPVVGIVEIVCGALVLAGILSMLLCSSYLVVVGAGSWSIDSRLSGLRARAST